MSNVVQNEAQMVLKILNYVLQLFLFVGMHLPIMLQSVHHEHVILPLP